MATTHETETQQTSSSVASGRLRAVPNSVVGKYSEHRVKL